MQAVRTRGQGVAMMETVCFKSSCLSSESRLGLVRLVEALFAAVPDEERAEATLSGLGDAEVARACSSWQLGRTTTITAVCTARLAT